MFDINLSEDHRWALSEVVTTEGKRLLKVPIAVKGSWKHPEYGDVTFDQKDFDDIIANWEKNVTGYEPPLYLGHDVNPNVSGGAPAVAFLETVYQDGDALYGNFDPVDDTAFSDVEKGKYRYSSAEVIPQAVSKETGNEVGTLLVGTALTNRPFLTGMPRVEVVYQRFSEASLDKAASFVFSTLIPKETPMETNTPSQTPAASAEQFSELARTVVELQNKLDATTAKLELTEAKLASQELTAKLDLVSKLTLPAGVKEQYSELLKAGSLDAENEKKVVDMMIQLSEDNQKRLATAQGQADPEVASSEAPVVANPYEERIKLNLKLAEARANAIQL